MKKKILLIMAVVFCTGMFLQTAGTAEKKNEDRGNDLVHIRTAQKLAELDGVREAAVVSCEERVLVGVSVLEGHSTDRVAERVDALLEKVLLKPEKSRVCVGDADAEKIIEFSLFLETNMDKRLLRKRFEFLAAGL